MIGGLAPRAQDATAERGRLIHSTTQTAGLALDTLNLSAVGDQVAVWEKVVSKLRAGAMPPVGRPQPDESARTTFVAWPPVIAA